MFSHPWITRVMVEDRHSDLHARAVACGLGTRDVPGGAKRLPYRVWVASTVRSRLCHGGTAAVGADFSKERLATNVVPIQTNTAWQVVGSELSGSEPR